MAEATCGDGVAAGDDEGGEDTEMGADKAPVQGDDEEKKTQWKCVAMAYNPDGTPKRSKGVYYPDIGMVWGEVV